MKFEAVFSLVQYFLLFLLLYLHLRVLQFLQTLSDYKKLIAIMQKSDKFGIPHPITGTHKGIDLKARDRTPIRAAERGRVSMALLQPKDPTISITGSSNLRIDHKSGYQTIYVHPDEIIVKEGDLVNKGQIVAYSGQRGSPGQPHLHFEIRKDNQPINPEYLLDIP